MSSLSRSSFTASAPLQRDAAEESVVSNSSPNKWAAWKKAAKVAATVVGVALMAISMLVMLTAFSMICPGAVPALAAFAGTSILVSSFSIFSLGIGAALIGTLCFASGGGSLYEQLIREKRARNEITASSNAGSTAVEITPPSEIEQRDARRELYLQLYLQLFVIQDKRRRANQIAKDYIKIERNTANNEQHASFVEDKEYTPKESKVLFDLLIEGKNDAEVLSDKVGVSIREVFHTLPDKKKLPKVKAILRKKMHSFSVEEYKTLFAVLLETSNSEES